MRTRMHPTIDWAPVESSSQGQPEPGHAATQPLGAGDEGLLAEAINFFNLPHPVIHRSGWEPLQFDEQDMTEMRAGIHDTLFEYLLLATHNDHIFAVIPSTKIQQLGGKPTTATKPAKPTKQTAPAKGAAKKPTKPKYPLDLNHRSRAYLLMRALLLPDWRSSGSATSFQLRPLKWDEIAPQIAQLRQLTRRSNIESQLRASFGDVVLNPPGGDQGLALSDPSLPETTLSERIYSQVGAVITEEGLQRYNGWPIAAEVSGYGTTFTLHQDVKGVAESILEAALPADDATSNSFPQLFGNWLETIDILEDWMARAASSDLGAAVGAPWGLAMTIVLRAYLVDALISLFMYSMPLSRLHSQNAGDTYVFRYPFGPSDWRKKPFTYSWYYNAMLGVGLWECMSGKLAPHPNKGHSGFLTSDSGDKLVKVMSVWTPDDMPGFWGGSAAGKEHQDLTNFIKTAKDGPCYLWASAGDVARRDNRPKPTSDGSDQLQWRAAGSTTLDGVFGTWTAHPRFFRLVDKKARRRPSPTSDEDQTGTLFSQLSLFAFQILAKYIMSALGLDGDAMVVNKEGHFGSGSLMWGGCNYTHREHRYGCVFDITHRFKHPDWDKRSVVLDKGKPAVLCYRAPLTHTSNANDVQSVVYDRYWYLTNETDKVVKKALNIFAEKTMPLADLEKNYLFGTPLHYTRTTKDAAGAFNMLQVNMVGNVALLLTAPWKVINGSPIMHLRSITLIREAFTEEELAIEKKIKTFLVPEFYFMPENHNDHWHANFYALSKSSGDPKGLAAAAEVIRGEGITLDVDGIALLCKFWRDLGVPIQDFVPYLKELEFETSPANIARTDYEQKTLLSILTNLDEQPAPDMAARRTKRLATVVDLLKQDQYIKAPPGACKLLLNNRRPITDLGIRAGDVNENESRQSEQPSNPNTSY